MGEQAIECFVEELRHYSSNQHSLKRHHGATRLGIGARYSQTEIDFDDTVGDVDIDATQVFVSLTTNF